MSSPLDETALQMLRRQRLEQAVARLTVGNVTAFARLLGYRDGAFMRQMLTGSRVVSDKTVRAIEALHGMEGWFEEASARVVAREPAAPYAVGGSPPEVVAIDLVALSLSAGEHRFTAERAEGPAVVFSPEWLAARGHRPEALLALRVGDESMQPSLYPGDVVTVSSQQVDPVDGQVFAVNFEGACLLRRLLRDGGVWWLVADNHLRFPRKALAAPHALLIGRVVHQQGETI